MFKRPPTGDSKGTGYTTCPTHLAMPAGGEEGANWPAGLSEEDQAAMRGRLVPAPLDLQNSLR